MDTLELNGLIWLILFPFVTISIIVGFLVMVHYQPAQRTLDAWLISLLATVFGDTVILVLTQAILFYRQYSIDVWKEELCHFYVWAWITLQFAQLFTLVGLSIDRVLLIKNRGKYAYYVSSKTKAVLFVLWLTAVFIGIVPVTGFRDIQYYYPDTGHCTYMPYEIHRDFAVFLVVAEVCSMVVCLVCLIDILCHLRYMSNKSFLTVKSNQAHSRRLSLAETSSGHKPSQVKKSLDVASAYDNCRVGCILVLVIFLLNHLPYTVMSVMGVASGTEWIVLRIIMIWLLLTQSLLLPHMLWIFNTRYRQALRHVIECIRGNGSLFTSETTSKNIVLETYTIHHQQRHKQPKPNQPFRPIREEEETAYKSYSPTGYSQYSTHYSTTRSFQYESFMPVPTKTVSEPNLTQANNEYRNQNGFLERSRSVDKDLDLRGNGDAFGGPSVGERDLQMDRVVAVVHGRSNNTLAVEKSEVQQSFNQYSEPTASAYNQNTEAAPRRGTVDSLHPPTSASVARVSPISSSSSTQSPKPKRLRLQTEIYSDGQMSSALDYTIHESFVDSREYAHRDVLDNSVGERDSVCDEPLQESDDRHSVSSDEHRYGKGHERLKRLTRKKSSMSSHKSSGNSSLQSTADSSSTESESRRSDDEGDLEQTHADLFAPHPPLKRSPANYNLHKAWREVHQYDRGVEEIVVPNSDIIVVDTDDVDEFSTSEFDETSVDEADQDDGHLKHSSMDRGEEDYHDAHHEVDTKGTDDDVIAEDLVPVHTNSQHQKVDMMENITDENKDDRLMHKERPTVSEVAHSDRMSMDKTVDAVRNDDIVIPSKPFQAKVRPFRLYPAAKHNGNNIVGQNIQRPVESANMDDIEHNANHTVSPSMTHYDTSDHNAIRLSGNNQDEQDTSPSTDHIGPSFPDVEIHREITRLDIEHFVTENPLYESLSRKERFEQSKRQIDRALNNNVNEPSISHSPKSSDLGQNLISSDFIDTENGNNKKVPADDKRVLPRMTNTHKEVIIITKDKTQSGSNGNREKQVSKDKTPTQSSINNKVRNVRPNVLKYSAVPYSGYTKAFYKQFSGMNPDNIESNKSENHNSEQSPGITKELVHDNVRTSYIKDMNENAPDSPDLSNYAERNGLESTVNHNGNIHFDANYHNVPTSEKVSHKNNVSLYNVQSDNQTPMGRIIYSSLHDNAVNTKDIQETNQDNYEDIVNARGRGKILGRFGAIR